MLGLDILAGQGASSDLSLAALKNKSLSPRARSGR